MTAYEQRSYPGAAADTVLAADLAIGGTAFSVTAGTGTGYPDGSQGPFFVIIDYDNSKAEKIRCSGRVNDTFTVAGTGGGRGQDSTTAQAHAAPAKVRACITATDVQEANRAAANTIGKITTKGDLLTGSSANTLARTAAGADGTLVQFDSTQPGGVKATAPITGAPVGTTDTQTLTGKTLTSPVVTGTWSVDATGLAQIQKPFGIFNDTLGTFLAINGAWNLATLATVTAKSTTLGGGSFSRCTASVTGTWRVSFNLVAPGGTGPWAVMIRKNAAGASGAGTEVATQANATVTGVGNAMNCSGLIQLNAGDYVEGFFWNGSGANQTIVSTAYDAMLLCMEYVSAP